MRLSTALDPGLPAVPLKGAGIAPANLAERADGSGDDGHEQVPTNVRGSPRRFEGPGSLAAGAAPAAMVKAPSRSPSWMRRPGRADSSRLLTTSERLEVSARQSQAQARSCSRRRCCPLAGRLVGASRTAPRTKPPSATRCSQAGRRPRLSWWSGELVGSEVRALGRLTMPPRSSRDHPPRRLKLHSTCGRPPRSRRRPCRPPRRSPLR